MPATSRSVLRPGLGSERRAARARMQAEGIRIRFVAPMVDHLARVAGRSTVRNGKGGASANVAMERGLPIQPGAADPAFCPIDVRHARPVLDYAPARD